MPSLFDSPHGGGEASGAGGGDTKAKDANCRTCTDFKSWARVQRGALDGKRDTNVPDGVRQVEFFIYKKEFIK